MVSWATMAWLVSLTVFGLIYTLLYDLYIQFYNAVLSITGYANTDALGVLYYIWIWMPVAFFLSSTFWYLVQAQRKESFQ